MGWIRDRIKYFFCLRFISALSFIITRFHYFFCSISLSLFSMKCGQVLAVTVKVIQKDTEEKKSSFNLRPYFRLFVNWIFDLCSLDPISDEAMFQVKVHVFTATTSKALFHLSGFWFLRSTFHFYGLILLI